MVPGTSNSVASRIGLPACRDSTSANSLARRSISAAKAVRIPDRSPGVVRDQPSYAARAAATAASTCPGPARAYSVIVSPVEGSITR